MELTKEHFDQELKSLATKNELAASEKRIIARIDESQAELARIVAGGFENFRQQLDVSTQIKTFERKFQKLEEALHIKL